MRTHKKKIALVVRGCCCSPRGVGQSVTECVVKPLCVEKVTGLKLAGTKNPTMLRVGVA
jgi:hypothetical protein